MPKNNKLKKIEQDARKSFYRSKDADSWWESIGNNYQKKWDKQVEKLKKKDNFKISYEFSDATA